jgi:FMN-dependent NADH-azoreductase
LTPTSTIARRDLGTDPLPHIDAVYTAAIRKPANARSTEEAESAKKSDELISEFLSAEVLVIGTGLINFNIYSSLKTWIDYIVRAGLTYKYTENGPVGLVTGKKAYVVLASGGIYTQGPAAPLNHAAPYLKSVLGFIGITDVETIHVEGLSVGPDGAEKAIAAARLRIAQLAAFA